MDTIDGRYRVVTASGSRYELDLDRGTLMRVPKNNEILDRGLRCDREAVRLVAVQECTVGREMMLLIDLGIDGVTVTSRRSTRVLTIEPLTPDADVRR